MTTALTCLHDASTRSRRTLCRDSLIGILLELRGTKIRPFFHGMNNALLDSPVSCTKMVKVCVCRKSDSVFATSVKMDGRRRLT
ncbi:Hypothetical protein CGB_F2424C [Cryptococcus gattii WM276]|uniref:Uncharacterized protein n=2 Tax=Cryptococcus gattii TaxID=37769 RepID=E6R806_CRYGW|nr:Hypothetical protein CGB_F2424C [Cryptococcus gattii WM276]ADV22942.1 Hypothetical protein CGB_F2424C [Cryptococcus gattii WM276]KJE00328.1 hypothetical protein I311_06070 [Cryptococcus gattii NT-10]